jgi:nucleoside-diphosphate-sugar epimerase
VGSHLADELLRRGAVVRTLVRTTSNLQWLQTGKVELCYGELRDPESLPAALDDVDYVFHLAGVVRARKPETFFRVNANGTAAMLEGCARMATPPKVVYLSSLAAGGPSANGPPLSEQDAPHPVSYYGRSKLDGEEAAAKYRDCLPIAIIRPPIIYGPRETDIFQLIKGAAHWGMAFTAGPSDTPLSIAHVQDVVQGIVLAAQSEKSAGEMYYVAGPEDVFYARLIEAIQHSLGKSVRRFSVPRFAVWLAANAAQVFSSVTGKPALLNKDKAREILAGGWTCSIDKITAELGYQPRVDIDEGMRSTVEWCRTHGWI